MWRVGRCKPAVSSQAVPPSPAEEQEHPYSTLSGPQSRGQRNPETQGEWLEGQRCLRAAGGIQAHRALFQLPLITYVPLAPAVAMAEDSQPPSLATTAADPFPLHAAVEAADAGLLQALLAGKVHDLDAGRGEEQLTPLNLAAAGNSLELVRLLLAAGASSAATDAQQRTALHHAASGNSSAAIPSLVAAGCPAEAADCHGNTALHTAALEDAAATIAALLAAPGGSACLAVQNDHGHTPLTAAASGGQLGALYELLASAALVPGQLEACLAATSAAGRTPREEAEAAGQEAAVAILSDPQWTGRDAAPAAEGAAQEGGGAAEAAELFPGRALEKQPGPEGEMLLQAAQEGNLEALEAALAAGASPDCQGEAGATALRLAAEAGHLSVVRALLAAGASVGAADDRLETPLQAASRCALLGS